jgi:hypothetical protein
MTEPKVEKKEIKFEGKITTPERVKPKVIQIATSTTNTGQVLLVALMDDGSMHRRIVNSDSATWVEVPAI